jgi:tetratricopeptide (TPR) repeat protein
MTGAVVAVAIAIAQARAAAAVSPASCAALAAHGRRADAQVCYTTLTRTNDHYLRAEGFWGLEQYQDANTEFRAAVAQDDRSALYRVRWGRLMHERFNESVASDLFGEALMRDPKNADAYLGLALVSATGFDARAGEYLTKALELNPKLVEAHELAASLSLEDSNWAQAAREADEALQANPEALDAMAIHAAVELLADRSPDEWLQKMLKVNPSYGKGYALVAANLVINRRYEEGVTYYRKAIELDPRLWSAHSELGINLMRLGQETEPKQHLELAYTNGYRNAATANSLKLLDSYKNFTTFRDDTVILKLNTKEAELLRPYFTEYTKRAIATYSAKYKVTLPGPVQIEVYPDHEDFAVRTMGLPGLGALGVTFGTVIAMDSPSGKKPGSFNWASTLWHEMDHVFVLTATNFRAPRWFAEGLAVHEEGEANPAWSDRLTPDIVVALKEKKLLPVAALDGGFVREAYPGQVLVSYYEASRMCDFIQVKWGAPKLVQMVRAFAKLDSTPTVIQDTLNVSAEEFDRQFLEWEYREVGAIPEKFDEWRGHVKSMVDLFGKGQLDEARTEGQAARAMYPQYVWDASPYTFLADIESTKGDKAAAIALLTDYRKFGGSDPDTLKKLTSLQLEAGNTAQAEATLQTLIEVYPIDADLHRRLGELWLKDKNYAGSIREYAAVVAMAPLDKAGALYDLAQAYFADGQIEQAEQTVLASLEAAPGYRPAQRLLLQLEDAKTPRPK